MEKNRLEAFSDGVLAIIITIMVLELKVPHGTNWTDLLALWPVFISYVLSFLYIGIYWGNHHHLMHTARRVNSGILLTNLHLLFWLSLIPFTTAWMGENHFESNPVALYAVNLTAAGIAYFILQKSIERHHAKDDQLKSAFQRHAKKRNRIADRLRGSHSAGVCTPHDLRHHLSTHRHTLDRSSQRDRRSNQIMLSLTRDRKSKYAPCSILTPKLNEIQAGR